MKYRIIVQTAVFLFLCVFMLSMGMYGQSEPESSQNVLRISAPKDERIWDVRPGAKISVTYTETERKRTNYKRLTAITNDALVMVEDTIALGSIISVDVAAVQQQRDGAITTLVGGGAFIMALNMLIISFFSVVFWGASGLIVLVIGSMIMGPIAFIIFIIGLIMVAESKARVRIKKGWRLRIVQGKIMKEKIDLVRLMK